ncbi:MAG TPA: glycosyltransferase family 4 protein [Acetobacteraceae bacterium]|jgi:glycosyltransferase involved in cell wall biosynthesis
MHVAVVNNIYPPIMAGGAELMVAWLSEALVARGHRVTVVSTCGPEMQPYPVEDRNGVTVIRFFPHNLYWNFARQNQKPYRRALWHLRDAWNRDAGRRFAAILADSPPDIVHTHLLDGLSATVWRRARQAGIPIVHTAHDYHLLCPRAFLLTRDWRICERPALGCRAYRAWHLHTATDVDLFISPSEFLLQRHRAGGLQARRTAVVRNGIPLPSNAVLMRGERSADRMRFLLLARLTPEKGVRTVLHAVAALPPELKFELVVAGRGLLEDEVRQAADRDPRIRFAGYVTGDAKEALLASAHHLIIPSLWYENAPVSVIEASAYGLGVIASRIGGLPEVVREGRTGLLFPPGDSRALAAAIRGLIGGDIQLPNLARESRTLAEAHTVDRMVESYLGHYGELLGSRAAGGVELAHAA